MQWRNTALITAVLAAGFMVQPALALTDSTPPTTAMAVTPDKPDGTNGYYKTLPTITLIAADNPGGSGVVSTWYKWDNGANQRYATAIPAPMGSHTITYWSFDDAGNMESLRTYFLKVDNTAPTIVAKVTPPIGPNGTYTSMPTVTFTVTDENGGSGMGTIHAKLDGNAFVPATFIDIPNGNHMLGYFATDYAGNASATQTMAFRVEAGRVLGTTVSVPVVRTIKAKTILATKLKNFNQRVVLTGENFDRATRVWIGKHEAQRVVYRSPNRLDVYIAMGTQGRGMWDVTVTTGDGQTTIAWKALRVR